MCPRRANECLVPRGTTAAASNGDIGKPAFAAAARGRQGPKNSRMATPMARLVSPSMRICASVIFSARSKTRRQAPGLRNGSRPSRMSTSPTALASSRPTAYFLPAAPGPSAAPAPRMALKKSELVSVTTTSDFLLKLARYASRLR